MIHGHPGLFLKDRGSREVEGPFLPSVLPAYLILKQLLFSYLSNLGNNFNLHTWYEV